jgi:hypothetical protein
MELDNRNNEPMFSDAPGDSSRQFLQSVRKIQDVGKAAAQDIGLSE